VPPEYALFEMDVNEIMAVLEELNEQDLNQMRQTRAICYYSVAAMGFTDANGKPKKVSINEFWPLPGDIKEIELPSAEEFEFDEQQAIKLAEKLSKHGREAI